MKKLNKIKIRTSRGYGIESDKRIETSGSAGDDSRPAERHKSTVAADHTNRNFAFWNEPIRPFSYKCMYNKKLIDYYNIVVVILRGD